MEKFSSLHFYNSSPIVLILNQNKTVNIFSSHLRYILILSQHILLFLSKRPLFFRFSYKHHISSCSLSHRYTKSCPPLRPTWYDIPNNVWCGRKSWRCPICSPLHSPGNFVFLDPNNFLNIVLSLTPQPIFSS